MDSTLHPCTLISILYRTVFYWCGSPQPLPTIHRYHPTCCGVNTIHLVYIVDKE